MLGEGKDVADVWRELQIAEQTYYRWHNQFGGLKAWPQRREGGHSGPVRRGQDAGRPD
jgi:hypothetical protein